MIIRAFEPLDLHRIRLQHEQSALPGWQDKGTAMQQAGPCWTALRHAQVLACAGLVLHWPGRAGCWCLIGSDLRPWDWPGLTRQVLQRMAQAQQALKLRRIEAEALAGWAPGARWLRLLGFHHESPMPAYGHDGADYDRWVMVRTDG